MHILRLIVPIILMFGVLFIKKIPKIGGNIAAAMGIAGVSAMLLGGIYNPLTIIAEWYKGIDQITWIIGLTLFGGILAKVLNELGAINVIVEFLRAVFGRSPKGLVLALMIALSFMGSLLGDAVAGAATIGILFVPALVDIGLSGELITAIIVIGSSMGSIMPPVSGEITLAASLLDVNPDPAIQPAFITVGLGLILVTLVVTQVYMRNVTKMPEELIPKDSAGVILQKGWTKLIPSLLLFVIVILRVIPGANLDIIPMMLNPIQIGGKPFLDWVGGVPILKVLSNIVCLCMLLSSIVGIVFYVRKRAGTVLKEGVVSAAKVLVPLVFVALMLAGFTAGGQIQVVTDIALSLNTTALIIGGGLAMVAVGMLSGSGSACQTTIFTFVGPALLAAGFSPVNVTIYGSHLAQAGQGMPPADLLTFMMVGLISPMIKQKSINPLKSMAYSSVFCVYLMIVGIMFMFLPAWGG